MADGTPHRVVGGILEGLAGGAQSLVMGINGAIQGLGENLQSALDAPPKAAGLPEQPLRIADRILDGTLNATANALNQGVVGSLKMEGEAIAKALDQPHEQFGLPPSLMGTGAMKPPRFGEFKSPFGGF